MPFLCSAYKQSSPQQEPITCQESYHNRPKSHNEIAQRSAYGMEKGCNVNCINYNNKAPLIDDCDENMGARFRLDFDVCTSEDIKTDQHPRSSVLVKRIFCTNVAGRTEIQNEVPCADLGYAKYIQALLCYVALNVVAAVFLGNKPIMPAFFASQFCGAMTIIYWRITGTLPI